MGASSSTQSNKSIEDIFAAETMFFNKAGTDDITELLKNIGEFADMHKRRLDTFRALKTKFVGDTGGKVIELKENEDIVDHLQNSMANLTPEVKSDIELLYSMHAIYAERTSNDKMMERKINVFPDFEEGYQYFYDKLVVLGKYKKIEVALDQNLISNDRGSVVAAISNARNKAVVTINKFLARNIFLTYAVIYNDYLSLIYTMYAAKQIRLLNDVYVKSKKQLEFDMITKRLEERIAESSNELKQSVTTRDQRIKELVKNLDTRNEEAKKRVTEFDAMSGGNTNTVNLLNQLVTEYETNLMEYTNSNTILDNYFETVNNIVFDSMEKLANFYINLSNNNNVINNNLRKAIEETTQQIRNMSNLTEKEADKRIMDITNQFSSNMSEQEKSVYFDAVGGPKGKVLKNLYMLQTDFTNNVALTNDTLQVENTQHMNMGTPTPTPSPRSSDSVSSLNATQLNSPVDTPTSTPVSTPSPSPASKNRINLYENPAFVQKPPPPQVASRSADVEQDSGPGFNSMYGGKKTRKYKRKV